MAWLRDIDGWFIDRILPHAAAFKAYARRLVGSDSDADDLVQEAYARVLGVEEWRRLDAPQHFVLRIIRNLAVERMRRARVVSFEQASTLDLSDVPDMIADPLQVSSARQDLRRVMAAFDRLPDKCREVMYLRKIQGLSPGAIAEQLDISVSTVEKHLAKGIRLLTETLADPEAPVAEAASTPWTVKKRTT